MSVKISAYIWEACAAEGIKKTKLLIMARLADFSNDSGISWPSTGTIARQIGAGRSTVITAIGELEKAGWLTSKERRNGQRNATNIYTLNVRRLKAAFDKYNADAPDSEHSDSEPSETERSEPVRSNSVRSESEIKSGSHGPETGPDPLVTSTTDPSDKNPSCQVAAQPDDAGSIIKQSREVLWHLNRVCGAKHTEAKSSMGHIKSRITEGFTAEELRLVVDYKHVHWSGITEYQYMRPKTLFIPGNLPGYLQSAIKWDKAGRPPRSEWNNIKKSMQRDVNQTASVDYPHPDGFRGE